MILSEPKPSNFHVKVIFQMAEKPKKNSKSAQNSEFYAFTFFSNSQEWLENFLNFLPFFDFRIWTCFEHSVVENNDMLRDRHVDQLLMCAVYVMAKVTKDDKSFHEIMRCYRTQPQASSGKMMLCGANFRMLCV